MSRAGWMRIAAVVVLGLMVGNYFVLGAESYVAGVAAGVLGVILGMLFVGSFIVSRLERRLDDATEQISEMFGGADVNALLEQFRK